MAERVVHALEMVEVEEHHRERLAPALRVQDREREPVVEQHPVRQVGQRIVIRLVPALLLGALAVGDVDEAAFHHGLASALGLEERLVREYPHRRAVPALQAELEIDENPLVRKPGQEGLPIGRLGIEVERGDAEDVFAGGIAEDPGEGRIAVENPAVERRPEEAGEVSFEEQPVTALGRAEGLVVPAEQSRDQGRRSHRKGAQEARHDENRDDQPAASPARGLADGRGKGVLEDGGALVEPVDLLRERRVSRRRERHRGSVNPRAEIDHLVDEKVAALPDLDRAGEGRDVLVTQEESGHLLHAGQAVAAFEEALLGRVNVRRRLLQSEPSLPVAERHGEPAEETPVIGLVAGIEVA